MHYFVCDFSVSEAREKLISNNINSSSSSTVNLSVEIRVLGFGGIERVSPPSVFWAENRPLGVFFLSLFLFGKIVSSNLNKQQKNA